MFSEVKDRLASLYRDWRQGPESFQIELAPKPEIRVPLCRYVEAAWLLFPDLFAAGQAVRENNQDLAKALIPKLEAEMPVFFYHFRPDKHPERLAMLMEAFGVNKKGKLPASGRNINPRIGEFFHEFNVVTGTSGEAGALVLIPGVEVECSIDVPYLSVPKEFYGKIVTVKQPQTDWYTELAEASLLALVLAMEADKKIKRILPQQVDVAGYSQGGRLVQNMILRLFMSDLAWGTDLLCRYTQKVRRTAVVAAASGVEELPLRSQAAVYFVDGITSVLGFLLAKQAQRKLVPDSGKYEIGRATYITRGDQIGDWAERFLAEIKRHSEIPTIGVFLDSLGLPQDWLGIFASKDDDVVGPARRLATLLATRWFPLKDLKHQQVPYSRKLWAAISSPILEWQAAGLRQ